MQLVDDIENAEYRQFKQQMGGTTGQQAAQRFAEIQGGYRPAFIGNHWIRYQAEQLRDRYSNMTPSP